MLNNEKPQKQNNDQYVNWKFTALLRSDQSTKAPNPALRKNGSRERERERTAVSLLMLLSLLLALPFRFPLSEQLYYAKVMTL